MYFFYIVRCKDGTLYSGSTKDIDKRIKLHNSGRGSIYVRTHGGGKIVYSERFRTRPRAVQREDEVKSWSRKKKLVLIRNKKTTT